MSHFDQARRLVSEFKESRYLFGSDVLSEVGRVAVDFGKTAVLVRGSFPDSDVHVHKIKKSLRQTGVQLKGEIRGAKPNAPREDLNRISEHLGELNPEVILSFGGGSTLDAVKAAEVLRTLGGEIEEYFGTNLVTDKVSVDRKALTPHIALQSAASSASHLTKYSNITEPSLGQKKLIVDDAIVPDYAFFDYKVTLSAPHSLTVDGALDGMAHCLEVLYGASGTSSYSLVESVATKGIGLIVEYLPKVVENPQSAEGREALALATDLGGYAIMLGGTNGAHLNSFSLVDILSHGRSCALLNPYYTVFFAPAIEEPLKRVADIFHGAGYLQDGFEHHSGRDLGLFVARAMIHFQESIGVPTTLAEVPGFKEHHVTRILEAAKNPQLRMKLENMPVPLTSEMVDPYMGSVVEAATTGDLERVLNVS